MVLTVNDAGAEVVIVAVGQRWGELVDSIVVVDARSKVMVIAIVISRERCRSQLSPSTLLQKKRQHATWKFQSGVITNHTTSKLF